MRSSRAQHRFLRLVYTTFGGSGNGITSKGLGGPSIPSSITIDNTGDILLAGTRWGVGSSGNDFALARFTADGLLDTSFGNGAVSGGGVNVLVQSGDQLGSSAVVTADGHIVMAGTCPISYGTQFMVAEYTSAGILANASVSGTPNAYSWNLNAVGDQTSTTTNSTTTTNTTNSQNQLTGFGTATLAYDNDGNTTTDENGHTLTYDALNRLVLVSNGATSLSS